MTLPTLAMRDKLPTGTFTVVRESDGKRITIRIRQTNFGIEGVQAPKVVAEYLRGSDNEGDYTAFAFVDPVRGTCQIWKRFKGEGKGEAWFKWVLAVLAGDPVSAGQAWSSASGKCFKCGRTLTTPESILQGIGPECVKRLG